MDLHILVSPGARIAEHIGTDGDGTGVKAIAFILKHPDSPGRHAVDTPVGLSIIITDGDGEPSVIRPHHLNGFPRVTRDR